MKQLTFKTSLNRLRLSIISLVIILLSLLLFSFSVNKLSDDFLQQLGISKTAADQKITSSILGGYLDQYGASNAKNIMLSKRAEVVTGLINYTKQKVNSPEFIKEYNAVREGAKPKQNHMQTPEEMRKEMIEQYTKSVKEMQAAVKNADASNKELLEGVLTSAREQLKQAKDPNNEMLQAYSTNYTAAEQMNEAAYAQQLQEWERQYPANHLLFVKSRLEQFVNETSGIDFSAQLIDKNGRKHFVNKSYESKSNRWKMAYRAGKEVVETARQQVQQWINEIN